MFRSVLTCLVILGSYLCAFAQQDSYYALVKNKGQWPEQVLFASDLEDGKVFLEKTCLTWHFMDITPIRQSHNQGKQFRPEDLRIKGHVYKAEFIGSNEASQTISDFKHKAYYNYFIDQNPAKWAGGCEAFGSILRKEFYPHIDLKFYSHDFALKYDFIVHPGGNAEDIQIEYSGMESLRLEDERLLISTSVNIVYEQKPIAWQIVKGEKKLVACNYILAGNRLSFSFPKGYDKNADLIIDPELIFSSYSGSSSDNFGYTATYDEDGFLYSGSSSFGQGYPITTGAYQITHMGGDSALGDGIDMALSKYAQDGTSMIYSTYLGGSGDDLAHSIITNSSDELLVYGVTGSSDFPVTNGAPQTVFEGGSLVSPSGTGANFPNGTDMYVAHFSASGSALIGCTFLGGSGNDGVNTSTFLKKNYADEFRGEISLDENENIVIVSSSFSPDYPTENAYQSTNAGGQDAVITKLNPGLTDIIWSTYLGGSSDDSGFSLIATPAGDFYVCGGSHSTDLPSTNGVVQENNNAGDADGYVARFSANAQNILALTYWGAASYDQLYFIELDAEGNVYVYGQTNSTDFNFIINAGYGTPNSGNLLTKFSPQLNEVIWSTVFGTGDNKPNLSPSAFLVDYCNRIYISGWGVFVSAGNPLNPGQNLFPMTDLETTSDAYDSSNSTGDFYMATFDDSMNNLLYGTFYGGSTSSEHVDGGTSRFDRKGVMYQSVCAGCGSNDDFPIYPSNAWSPTNGSSNCNNGVYKFDFQLPLTVADFTLSPSGCVNAPIQFTSTSIYSQTYNWDFGDTGTSNLQNPTHIYDEPGLYLVTLIVNNPNTCNESDTLQQTILIVEQVIETLTDYTVCEGDNIALGPLDSNPLFEYSWSPSSFLSNATVPNPQFTAGSSTNYVLTVSHDGCEDTYFQNVVVPEMTLNLPEDTTLCDDILLTLDAIYTPANSEITWSDQSDFSNVLNDNTSDASIEVSPLTPTTYYALIAYEGCELEDEVFVNLVSFQTVVEGDFTACENDTVTLSILEPNPEFNYSWGPSNLILSGQNTSTVEVFVPEETTFTVYSETPFGCTASDEVIVTVSELQGSMIEASANPSVVVQGQSSQLTVEPSDYDYIWTPSTWLNNTTIQNPTSSPLETITYEVTVNDGECSATASVTVRVVDFVCGPPSIYIPNTFTPNKDERNEKMFVRANNIDKLYFVIYDRWGEKMFETTTLNQGWDGTFKGKDLDPDVYVYYLEATCEGGSTYFEEGNISLIR
ncbi:MAG: PKD domain-containing protein [Flavobacteriales bacterium]